MSHLLKHFLCKHRLNSPKKGQKRRKRLQKTSTQYVKYSSYISHFPGLLLRNYLHSLVSEAVKTSRHYSARNVSFIKVREHK